MNVFQRAAALLATPALVAFAVAAQAEPPTGATVDGIRCDQAEGAVFHIHQHLTLLDHGKNVPIPDDVGRPLLGNCLYWIHTHTPDGIIHVESPLFRTFTLGNFFDVWGEPLSPTAAGPVHVRKGTLRVYVNGSPYHGDPRKIELSQHTDITLEAGPPYRKPRPFNAWQGQ
ncbi:MAG: hypothetical protein GIX03_05365 [Candidatus Eremiobacteraeota bacterium]|nr:hypothetical protein [Candidatus Eremiobacteraeota bacterium]MBC5802427.1 hypothetical protein [Candidatus Eremiobacteraeota bacterium]MBC5821616.1 hypothetical protein [Candidatus Eremiobacteraeota bacterium]